jgi:DNA-binding response OmpR family regulator
MSPQVKGDTVMGVIHPTSRFEARFRGLMDACRPLLVEDDPADARLLTEAFKRCGVPARNIEVAIDGEQALLLLATKAGSAAIKESSRPSFIVLDLRLRRKTGANVLEWLRAEPTLAAVPVMVLTGMEQAQEADKAKKLGADSCYFKPLLFSELVTTARAMLDRWRETLSLPSETPATERRAVAGQP